VRRELVEFELRSLTLEGRELIGGSRIGIGARAFREPVIISFSIITAS
jgi:hypothetical protein